MQTTNQLLKPIIIPIDHNNLFTAVTLCVLLPVLKSTDVFDERFERLFGDANMRAKRTTLNGYQG